MLTASIRQTGSVLCVVVPLWCAAVVQAQGVGNLGQLPPIIPMNTTSTGWEVGVPTPIPVVRDPLGPVWKKDLTNPNGGPFQAIPGQTFHLREALVVTGNRPWSDWHEDILNPDWSWTGAQIFINGAIPAGLVINNTPGTPLQGGSISFLFNSVAPGSTVDIFKHLTYHGNPAVPPFNGILHVNQYPTPEPAAAGLLGLAATVFLRRRRRMPS